MLGGGAFQTFAAALNTAAVGEFSAIYTLIFSDENIAGRLNKSLTLTLSGQVKLLGDYNGNNVVDAGDYTLWRSTFGEIVTAFSGADGNGSGSIDAGDYEVWTAHLERGHRQRRGALAAVPEPASVMLAVLGFAIIVARRNRRPFSGRG